MPEEKTKSQSLSIFLIREGWTPARYLKPGATRLLVRRVGDLYVRQNPARTPRWLDFFDTELDERPKLSNASAAGLLTVKRGARTFALSFGHGRHLLQPGSWEENFGLRVTLNSVDPGRLKSVDRKTFDAISCHTRTQASQEGDVTAFGLNVEQDLLRAATGLPVDEALGMRMSGMDSLLVSSRTKLRGVPALLDRYLEKFEDDSYKQTFPWVDHIAEVRDPNLRARLDEDLLKIIRKQDPSEMPTWLAVPDLIDWHQVGGFRYRDTDEAERYPDLHIRDFLESVSDRSSVSLATLKQRYVFAYGVEDDHWTKRWPVYACLYGELERDDTTYLLTSGKWYRVEGDFVASVNADIGIRSANRVPDVRMSCA